MDGSSRQTVSTSQVGAWVWARGRAYSLSEGLHTLELGGHQPGAEADRILLTDDPSFTATEQPGADVDPPAGVVGFTATANASSNTLTWTNPDVPDLARTVIRYRTDGLFPVSPSDGFPLVDRGAAPGAPESFVHQNVASGVTYSYSAFAVDEAGNASDESTAQATPGSSSSPPPGSS